MCCPGAYVFLAGFGGGADPATVADGGMPRLVLCFFMAAPEKVCGSKNIADRMRRVKIQRKKMRAIYFR